MKDKCMVPGAKEGLRVVLKFNTNLIYLLQFKLLYITLTSLQPNDKVVYAEEEGEEEEEEEEVESLTISALAPGFSKSRFFSSMYPPIFLTFSIHASAGPLSPRILAQVTAQNY